MQKEIDQAIDFILSKIPDSDLNSQSRSGLRSALTTELTKRYNGHWYPQTPTKGSAYRALTIWSRVDPIIIKAAKMANINPTILSANLPKDLTIWCDPHSVSYRIGDYGSCICVYENKRELLEHTKRHVAERVNNSSTGDFVISAYTAPVVIRRATADRVPSPDSNTLYSRSSSTKATLKNMVNLSNSSGNGTRVGLQNDVARMKSKTPTSINFQQVNMNTGITSSQQQQQHQQQQQQGSSLSMTQLPKLRHPNAPKA